MGLALVLLDSLAISLVVGDTGGADSPFSPLYLVAALGLIRVGDTARNVLGAAALIGGYLAAVAAPVAALALADVPAALLSPGVALGAGLVALSCCVAGALGVRLRGARRTNGELSETLAAERRHVEEAEALVSRFGRLADMGLDGALGWSARVARELTGAEFAHAALLDGHHHSTAAGDALDAYPTWWHPEVQRMTMWSCRENEVLRNKGPVPGISGLLAVPIVADDGERLGALTVGGGRLDAEGERALRLLAIGVAPVLRGAKGALGGRDTVTGLPNRASLYRALERELRRGVPLAVLLLDLGGDLRLHNRRHGFASGDDLLRRVGRRLEESSRSAFYHGGGAFAVLLSGADAARANRIGLSLRRAVADLAPPYPLRASVGHAAVGPGEVADPTWIVDAARTALEEAVARPRSASSAPLDPGWQRVPEGVQSPAVAALLRAIEARSDDLGDHSRAVASLARRVGARMALSPTDLDALTTGALLHDVGKIGLPDSILHSPLRLSAQEYEVVKGHAEAGARILQADESLSAVLPVVKHHHERFDGAGYPGGLAGKDIPLAARIVHAVDAFDSMVRDRSYRRGTSPQDAVGELQRHAGTQFDPSVVQTISELLGEADGERRATS
jgi:diguanylate cyclase (GGDEF)-like protein/putative nucleotidyltransferase with HDIG domain